MFNKKILLILAVGLTISFSVPAEALWLSGYEYRKEITIDHTKIGSDLSDFPLAVMLSDTTNIIDGNDVKFTLADGETLLNYEKEKYAVNDAVYWVNLPTVSSGTDTKFYMYYGKESDTDESTNAIWDSNYRMVQHLEETDIDGGSGDIKDSTAYGNNGTTLGMDTDNQIAGKIDGSFDFDGSIDGVALPAGIFANNNFTWESWIQTSATGTYQWITSGRGDYYEELYIDSSTNKVKFFYEGSSVVHDVYSNNVITDGAWHHIVGVKSSTQGLRLYIDGILQSDVDTGGTTNADARSSNSRIGSYNSSGETNFFNGIIDEVRVSNIARDADWIETSYYSGSNALLTFGNEEGGEVVPEPASLLLLGFGVLGIALFKRRLS